MEEEGGQGAVQRGLEGEGAEGQAGLDLDGGRRGDGRHLEYVQQYGLIAF